MSDLRSIVVGPDGNLWFAQEGGHGFHDAIERMTPQGKVTGRFETPEGGFGTPGLSIPDGLIAGPDGNLWFHGASGAIGRLTPHGTITEFDPPSPAGAAGGLAVGPDGALWFADSAGPHVGRLT